MTRREWRLSALFVAVIALKIAEGVFRLESWPLSDVRMFSNRVAPSVALYTVTLAGTRGGEWFPLPAMVFGLNDEELRRRLPAHAGALPASCGALGKVYNARNPGAPLTRMTARMLRIARPGIAAPPGDWNVECPFGTGG